MATLPLFTIFYLILVTFRQCSIFLFFIFLNLSGFVIRVLTFCRIVPLFVRGRLHAVGSEEKRKEASPIL